MLLLLDILMIVNENILLFYRVTRSQSNKICYQIETSCPFPQSQEQDHLGHGARWSAPAYSLPISNLF